ncbi:MAG: gliding motility protein GldM [Muribaculaceae bacterium]|nr:gliding motility protein GldM [Muribaculaceae bacterium]
MGSNSNRLSPRQKMINLMYIVLTAMLALNVSSDVLDGFTQVHDGLTRTNRNVGLRNGAVFSELEALTELNPDKGRPWLEKASELRAHTDSLTALIEELKLEIVREADGKKGDVNNIQSRDDLEAASVVMLSPGRNRGAELRERIDAYREHVCALMPDTMKRANLAEVLSTDNILRRGTLMATTWEESRFEQQPVVAAVTILAKLQNDVLYAEGEALSSLLSQVDAGDVRVNELHALVLPQSRLVIRGGKYSANIVLAAVDTTQRPQVFVGGKPLGNDRGLYEFTAGNPGNYTYEGYLEVPLGDGSVARHPFSSSYTVMEPMATVSATMMNVLYAGIENPISISVPGVAMSDISATMTNGSLTRQGDHWVAKPGNVGQDAVISVTATMDGKAVPVAQTTFRVRKLPDPTPYIAIKNAQGQTEHYKGSKPIAKASLLAAEGLGAAIDDGLLDTPFKVLGFQTIMFDGAGNAMAENSEGANFSQRQRQQFQRLSRGKRFFISRVRAVGPDGITRDLSPMEVIVN